ncbi:CapA family protein [Paenibacillus sp. FSL W8-0186]|uniref:CapA family protein n=1 Tax=Paenibacillus sp. FSL W8-0186 TaxID=2921709 RepID=UPI0030D245D9
MTDLLEFYAVGDVGPNREKPSSIFQYTAPFIQQGDLAFCQLEPALSRRGSPLPQARLSMRADPSSAEAIREAGFHVVSFASNHCMDWGIEAFQDTLDALKAQQLQVIGAGRHIDEARAPAIMRVKGTRVAFLAYNSILPQGYWAESDRPGCAPLRAHTLYEQIEHDQPGTPCRVHTYAHSGDMKGMLEDIQQAKKRSDVVVVSMHWGIHFVPAVIADYQKELAYAAIDAGADLILGHHPHILKGIEMYKGKAIFYSLANFALESPFTFAENLEQKESHKEIAALHPDFKQGSRTLPKDSLKSIMVKCLISPKGIEQVAFLPVMIDEYSDPHILSAEDQRFDEVLSYLKHISEDQGLMLNVSVQGNEVLLQGELVE